MSSHHIFETSSDGKLILTDAGKVAVKEQLSVIQAERYPSEVGATKPAFYKWLQGGAISKRGQKAITLLLEFRNGDAPRSLTSHTIEELVAALKAKGCKSITFTM